MDSPDKDPRQHGKGQPQAPSTIETTPKNEETEPSPLTNSSGGSPDSAEDENHKAKQPRRRRKSRKAPEYQRTPPVTNYTVPEAKGGNSKLPHTRSQHQQPDASVLLSMKDHTKAANRAGSFHIDSGVRRFAAIWIPPYEFRPPTMGGSQIRYTRT